jgi:transcription antitermination factor NusG
MKTESKTWLAVYTKPRWEKKVARHLEQKNIENYCPLNMVQHQWSDRKKIILEPLFKSYVFVRISETEKQSVLQTNGVMNFVYWLKKPAVIRDDEIITIRKFMNEYKTAHLIKTNVDLNDRIRIIGGPLMEREGIILEVKHKTVKILLPSLGYTIVAEIEKNNLEKINLHPVGDFNAPPVSIIS